MFCDWEFGVTNCHWDRPQTIKGINSRLTAFAQVNSARDTVAYQWSFMTIISDLVECMKQHGWKKNHNWVSIAVDKHEKTNKSFYYQTSLVFFTFFVLPFRFLSLNLRKIPSSAINILVEKTNLWQMQTSSSTRRLQEVLFSHDHSHRSSGCDREQNQSSEKTMARNISISLPVF